MTNINHPSRLTTTWTSVIALVLTGCATPTEDSEIKHFESLISAPSATTRDSGAIGVSVYFEIAHSKYPLAEHYLRKSAITPLTCGQLTMWSPVRQIECDSKLFYYLVPALVEQPFTGRFNVGVSSNGHLHVSHIGLGSGGKPRLTALLIGSPRQVFGISLYASAAR